MTMADPTTARRLWFEPDRDQHRILASLREFLRDRVSPGALERDRLGEFPSVLVAEAADLGLFGLQVPEEYGGAALDTATSAFLIAEIAAVDGSLCLTVASHNSLCVGHILLAGNEEQKSSTLPDLASGQKLGAWALTEPGSGSDAAALKTRAVDHGDHYVLSGSKMFITQGTVAGCYVVIARTDPPGAGRSASDGISAFIVDGDSDGLVRGKPEAKLGLHSSDTTPLTLEGVRVPARNLLGERGKAFRDVLRVLAGGRIGIGAMGVGIGRGALDAAALYALERQQFGKPIVANQGVSFRLADMATELEAAWLLVLKASALRDAERDFQMAASMAKLKGSVAGVDACDQAIQVLGGYGYMQEYQVERMWRDARLTRIGEGTDEIQRVIIARELLKQYS